MREYWKTSLCFMLALGLVCASSVAHADFVRQHIDDAPLGVTVRLTDFAELQPLLPDPGLPSRMQGGLLDEPRFPRSPRERSASLFMPNWDTYAASYSVKWTPIFGPRAKIEGMLFGVSNTPMNYIALSSFLVGLKYEFVVPATPDSGLVSVVHR